jgi:hypothetical protein
MMKTRIVSFLTGAWSFFTKRSPSVLLYNKTYCKIYLHREIQVVHLDWKGQASRDQFVDACNFSLQILIETGAKKMVADNSKVTFVSPENQRWLTENWFPRALEEGFQYSAVISASNDEVRSALQLIVNQLNTKHIIVRYFADVAYAKTWLENVD